MKKSRADYTKLARERGDGIQNVKRRCEPLGLNEQTAQTLAGILGGEPWQSGGGIWLVLIRCADDRLIVVSDGPSSLAPQSDAAAACA